MTATIQARPWDFSHVLGLVNSLSNSADSLQPRDQVEAVEIHEAEDNEHDTTAEYVTTSERPQGLGDFSKLWQFLETPSGSPSEAPAVQIPSVADTDIPSLFAFADYASDSALYFVTSSRTKPATKTISKRLRKSLSAAQSSTEEKDVGTASDGSALPNIPKLTKSQRKKRNRRDRREKDKALAEEEQAAQTDAVAATAESEPDSAQRKPTSLQGHVNAPITPKNKQALPAQASSTISTTAKSSDALLEAANAAARRVDDAKRAVVEASYPGPSKLAGDLRGQNGKSVSETQHSRPAAPQNGHTSINNALNDTPTRKLPPATPSGGKATRFFPSTVQPHSHSAARPVSMQQQSVPSNNPASTRPARTIEPMIVRSGEDRSWALLIKLIGDFFADRKYLVSPMNLTTHNNDPKGIHVFVDASNIFIGFNEQLKRSRSIPSWVQVPPVGLSFDALALLMERRRPVAKRVLVGSTPHLEAFDKARAVGYECNILEKVYKARELTERQIFFNEHYRNGQPKRARALPNNVATLNGGHGSGNGSGSETNAPQYAPARMIEQGVDEILHLKILESVVDTDVPGTIVLATGDAARAEYSEGFMAMAERALKKGWTVELVSWSANISSTYTMKEWMQAWGDRFRIVLLDDYAEELLDM